MQNELIGAISNRYDPSAGRKCELHAWDLSSSIGCGSADWLGLDKPLSTSFVLAYHDFSMHHRTTSTYLKGSSSCRSIVRSFDRSTNALPLPAHTDHLGYARLGQLQQVCTHHVYQSIRDITCMIIHLTFKSRWPIRCKNKVTKCKTTVSSKYLSTKWCMWMRV